MFTPRVERRASRLARSCLSRSCVSSSVLCRGDRGSLVHRDARALACFHARAKAFSILCRFSRFDPRGILAPSALPQSSFTRFAAHAFRRSRVYPSFGPPHDTTRSRPPVALRRSRGPSFSQPHRRLRWALRCCGKLPRLPLRSVLRRSQPLDGLLRARAHGLVSSRSHVQDHHRSRASLSMQQRSLVESALPPCR
jgi:hypothetical protein